MNFRSNKKNVQTVFLDDIISTDKDGNSLSLYEVMCDNAPSVDRQIENKILYKKIENIVLSKLEPREKEIIINRFGLFGNIPKTQFELADSMKISRSYISRIEKKAINTIKNTLFL
jgi:RNA polymerase sporulation-specific sigma factor